jgi:hypothetical protein
VIYAIFLNSSLHQLQTRVSTQLSLLELFHSLGVQFWSYSVQNQTADYRIDRDGLSYRGRDPKRNGSWLEEATAAFFVIESRETIIKKHFCNRS